MLYQEYKDAVERIHAPRELKEQVLAAARDQQADPSRKKTEKTRVRSRLLPRIAAAAVLALVLPLAAYAAFRYLDLKGYLSQRGLENPEAVEQLTALVETTAPAGEEAAESDGLTWYENDYARYAVTEAVCDSGTIYLAALIQPLSEDYFLVPNGVFWEDSVSNLRIPGVTGTETVAEYAASLGKTPVCVDVSYRWGEETLFGVSAHDFQCYEDGSVSCYTSGANTTGLTEIPVTCFTIAQTESMSMEELLAQRKSFEILLRDRSSTSQQVYTRFDPALAEELGQELELLDLTLEQTELGLYASFHYRLLAGEGFHFQLVDSSGRELELLPLGSGYDHQTLDDGTGREVLAYQIPDSLEDLSIVVRRPEDAQFFGPYTFE